MTTVALCLPSRGRALQLSVNATALLQQALPVSLVVMLTVCENDTQTVAVARKLSEQRLDNKIVSYALRPDDSTAVQGWNLAHMKTRGCDWFVLGADDVVWREGWLREALTVARRTGAQVIGLNDGDHTPLDAYGPHFMVHTDFVDTYLGGHLAPPVYAAWWFDREVCEIAQRHNLYAPAWNAYAEHRHPDWGQAAMDDTYNGALALRKQDETTYRQRKANNYKAAIV